MNDLFSNNYNVFNQVPVPIIILNIEDKIEYINIEAKKFCEVHSININELTKWLEKELHIFKESGKVEEIFKKEVEIENQQEFLEIKLKSIYDGDILIGTSIVIENITDKEVSLRRLEKTQKNIDKILMNAPIMMDAIDKKGNMVVWNRKCEEITGYSAEEVINNPKALEILYPNDDYRKNILAKTYQHINTFHVFEWDITCKDGTIKTISWFNISRQYPINCWDIWGFGVDITEQRKMEMDLKTSEKKYRTFFERCPNYILVLDIENNSVIEANGPLLDRIGITLEQLKNINNENSIYFMDFKLKMKEVIVKLKCGRAVNNIELVSTDVKGEKFFVEVSFAPIFEYGNLSKVLCFGMDITEKKKNAELRQKFDENLKLFNEAVEYDKLKTEFFANISHELRTPINIIYSSLQLMNLYFNKEITTENFDKINKLNKSMKQNCYRLLRLVNNLIDITKIDTGYLVMNIKKCDIISLIENITLSIVGYAESKSISITFDTDVEEKFTLCDPDKIERIMLNLLSNAIKFTKSGGKIWVNLFNRGKFVEIQVKDTGIGIPKDKIGIIFDRFRQVNKSLARENEGSGIGLSIVKSLVEMHKGKISVQSDYGKGTEFIVQIPIVNDNGYDKIACDKNMQTSSVKSVNIEFSDIYF